MSAPENEITDDEPERTTDDVVEQGRRRPPDLVGTRPEWDPAALTPKETPRAAAGRLWAPAEGEEARADDREAVAATAAAPSPAADPPPTDDTPRYSRYSARFQFLLGALLAIGAAAVALLFAVLVGGANDDHTISARHAAPWSKWEPSSPPGLAAAQEIAKHVGAEYRQADGQQLVLVDGSGLEIADLPVTIVIQHPIDQGGNGTTDLLDDGVGVMYRLCGVESEAPGDCRLSGTPSPNRMTLLRREALELALYSFRYLGVSEAVVLMPPAKAQPTDPAVAKLAEASGATADSVPGASTALLFRRSSPDVQAALSRPLAATLSSPKVPTVSQIPRSPDTSAVHALTDSKTYSTRFQPANQDYRFYLVLAPLRIH